MGSHPPLKLKTSRFELWIELVAYPAIIGYLIIFMINFRQLPQTIPSNPHYPEISSIDKEMLVFFPITIIIIFIGLSFLSRHPHWFTFPVPINKNNMAIQYRLARYMIAGCKAVMSICILFVEWQIMELNISHATGLQTLFIPLIMTGIVIVFIIYLSYAIKNK